MKKSLSELIPKQILQSLVNGAGRQFISERFGLSDTDARKFVNTYEIFNLSKPIDFYEIDDLEYGDRQAKVLVFDIETLPIEALLWGMRNQFLTPVQIKKDWCVVTWRAKWLHGKEIFGDSLTPKEAISRNDKRIMQSLWIVLNEADIVIAHYGDKFDIRRVNGRFFFHGIRLPSPYQSIDTCKTAMSRMHLTSYKLNEVARVLGIGQKIETDFQLWKDCDAGCPIALGKMGEYNDHDVDPLLEKVYLALRPYIKGHPNLGIYTESTLSQCPACNSGKIIEDGFYVTTVSEFQAYYCDDCFSLFRSRKSIVTKEKRKNLMVSLAR